MQGVVLAIVFDSTRGPAYLVAQELRYTKLKSLLEYTYVSLQFFIIVKLAP